MFVEKVAGATSEIWQVFVKDSSVTTGVGLAGLAFNTGSLTAYYHRDTDTTATAITLATMTVGTFTSSGFKEIDATHMPGWYQFCPPNAALASGAKSCAFWIGGAANMSPVAIDVQLMAVNPDSATAFMTSVATAVALTTNNDKTGYTLSNTGMDNLLTRAMTEAYSTDGATMTPAQALYEIKALLSEFAISGTTLTTKKVDGSTTAATYTLDSASNPTSITRSG
jgi:hypothetical protein